MLLLYCIFVPTKLLMVVNILNFLHLNNVQMDQIQIGF